MANQPVVDLTEKSTPANGDDFLIEDNVANETKKIGYDNLKTALNADLNFNLKSNLAGGNSFTGTQSFGDGVIERFSGQILAEAGTTKTLAASDNGKVVRTTSGSDVTITIPTALTVGFNCMIIRDGAGEVEFAVSGGMNLRHPNNHDRINLRYSAVSLLVVASNECILMGDTKL